MGWRLGRVTGRRRVVRIDSGAGQRRSAPDTLAAEEPLEIRAGPVDRRAAARGDHAHPWRRPGPRRGVPAHRGLIAGIADVATARLCAGPRTPNSYNVVDVTLAAAPPPDTDPTRHFYTTSSCGVCGKASIDAVRTRSRYRCADDRLRWPRAPWPACPTGCARPSGSSTAPAGCTRPGCSRPTASWWCCARTSAGTTPWTRWSAGRPAGSAAARGHVLLVSGRASFELTQKAWMAGVPVLAAVSAPSTLAVDLADEAGHDAGRLPPRVDDERLHPP